MSIQVGSFLDTVTTNKNMIFAIDSYSTSVKNTICHAINLNDLKL